MNDRPGASLKRQEMSLRISIVLNFLFAGVEVAAGLFANSLTLLSDSLHDFSDATSLILSYVGLRLSEQRPTGRRTFGYRKVRILTAFINALVLIALTTFILRAAAQRILHPQAVKGHVLVWLALLGMLVNGLAVLFLRRDKESLNIRIAWFHLLEDFLGWIAVLAGGALISLTGWFAIDPALSVVISVFVIVGAYSVFRDSARILIDSTPHDIDFHEVQSFILGFDPSIRDLHDLHIWTIGEGERALMSHLVVPDDKVSRFYSILSALECSLREKFDITHVTLELECSECKSGSNVCLLDPPKS